MDLSSQSLAYSNDRRRRILISQIAKHYKNIMSKHRGWFPEGQSPIVLWDIDSNAEYNIKY